LCIVVETDHAVFRSLSFCNVFFLYQPLCAIPNVNLHPPEGNAFLFEGDVGMTAKKGGGGTGVLQ